MSENPYDPPKSPEGSKQQRGASGRIAAILLSLLAIPAALIAALTICNAAIGITNAMNLGDEATPSKIGLESTPANIGLWMGAITGFVVFVFMIWAAGRKLRRK